MAVTDDVRAALKWGDEEIAEFADEFLDHKVFTYTETLADLAEQHGYEIDPDIELPDAILTALRAEARDHARSVVETFNADVDAFLERNADVPQKRTIDTYEAWAVERNEARSDMVAISEAYPAAADATLAFYTANRGDTEYDFGGHGDAEAQCPVCQILEETSPHPTARVVDIGSPHIGCRQEWHAVDGAMADEFTLPTEPAGIVGSSALVSREGSHEAAVDVIRGLTA